MSQIPTKTGAAAAVGLVMPELKGKLDGFVGARANHQRVARGSHLHAPSAPPRSRKSTRRCKQAAAAGPLKGILAYNDAPLVSVDFNHDAHSSIFDATLTKVIDGTLVKVCAWYDNEWGFSNRMLDTTLAWSKAS